jgi:hypothetical protein
MNINNLTQNIALGYSLLKSNKKIASLPILQLIDATQNARFVKYGKRFQKLTLA